MSSCEDIDNSMPAALAGRGQPWRCADSCDNEAVAVNTHHLLFHPTTVVGSELWATARVEKRRGLESVVGWEKQEN